MGDDAQHSGTAARRQTLKPLYPQEKGGKRMNLRTLNCADARKLQDAEGTLQARGYRRVYKQSENNLQPGEYLITQCTGTINDLRWCRLVRQPEGVFKEEAGVYP